MVQLDSSIDASKLADAIARISESHNDSLLSHSDTKDAECKCDGVNAVMLGLAVLATGVVYNVISMGGGGRKRKRRYYNLEYGIEFQLKGIKLKSIQSLIRK